eukprot:6061723-Pyramimonas_sp.AAC.1
MGKTWKLSARGARGRNPSASRLGTPESQAAHSEPRAPKRRSEPPDKQRPCRAPGPPSVATKARPAYICGA